MLKFRSSEGASGEALDDGPGSQGLAQMRKLGLDDSLVRCIKIIDIHLEAIVYLSSNNVVAR